MKRENLGAVKERERELHFSEKSKIEKKKKCFDSCKEKGITLITLVVTVTVMLILASVSIAAVLGDNGILKEAKRQKQKYEASQSTKEDEMQELLNEMAKDNKSDGNSGGDDDWNKAIVDKVKSEDNIVVPVPRGYVASTVEGEKSVSTGFVIKEGDDGGATEGINEFVWVPVSNISDIYDEANNAGQLWSFSGTTSTKSTYPTSQNSDYREPDVVTYASSGSNSTSGSSYDADSSNLQQAGLTSNAKANDFKVQLQTEFNEMIESVKIYGGFYIGRYETGNLSNATKAVVQKNNSDISNQTWYTMYRMCKTIKANYHVYTGMIWGCQWDATMRWMQTSEDESVKNFPTSSAGKGRYNTSKAIATGSNSTYSVNNIYDMAGNVYEWTLEALGTRNRSLRGGSYNNKPMNDYNASGRSYADFLPTYSNSYNGCRTTLYIVP